MRCLCFILIISSLLLHACYAQDMQDSMFFKQTLCDVESRLEHGCSNKTLTTRGLLDCLTACNEENVCIGASVSTNDSSCYIHRACPDTPVCSQVSDGHDYYSKNCHNNGKWNSETNSCVCQDGMVGENCNRLPKHCDELITYGYTSTTYRVTLDLTDKNLGEIEVLCKIKSTSPTNSQITFMKNSGLEDSTENWDSYVNRFESGASHKWWGLKNWNTLSKAGYTTLVVRAIYYMPAACVFEWHYEGFLMSDESKNFKFTFDSVTNTTSDECGAYRVEDCFSTLQNVSFSTKDMDNDWDEGENCSQRNGAGWWYKDCDGPCHLLGWRYKDYKGIKQDEKLMEIDGIDTEEMKTRLDNVEMILKN